MTRIELLITACEGDTMSLDTAVIVEYVPMNAPIFHSNNIKVVSACLSEWLTKVHASSWT